MGKKCMQNFGEENCRTATPTTLETDPEMLARMEMVKVVPNGGASGLTGLGILVS